MKDMEVEKQRQVPAWIWVAGIVTLVGVCLCVGIVITGSLFLVQAGRSETPVAESSVVVEEQVVTPPTTVAPPATLPATDAPTEEPAAAEPPTVESPTTEPPTAEAPADEPTVPPPTPEDSQPGATESPENAAIRAEIEENVAEIRGLEPLEPVVTTVLTRDELTERVENDLFAELTEEDAREFTLILSAYDFVPRDFDYYNFTLDLYSEQIAGFYDSETNEFVVVSDDNDLDVLEQLTHAHEYMHALQDQHFSLELLDDEGADSEAVSALSALAEGEATLLQTLYLMGGYFSFEDLGAIITESADDEFPVLESAPPVLANNLLFPYTSGVAFVQYLYDQGGFAAVDDAWADPPLSTEHILHPDRYLAGDVPQIVSTAPLTDTLGTGWRLLDEEVFGEFFLREYLSQQLSSSEVDVAATGWGGDRYAVYWNEEAGDIVGILDIAWDTPQDGDEFAQAFANFAESKYGASGQSTASGGVCWQGEDVTCLFRFGSDTFVVRAPDLTLAEAIAAAQ